MPRLHSGRPRNRIRSVAVCLPRSRGAPLKAHSLPPRGRARTPEERTSQVNPGTVLLLGLLVLVYLNFVGRRRAQRNRVALQERLVRGAQVVTTSGLHATVTEVGEDGTVLLQTAPGQVTRWEKVAVGRVVESPADAVAETADELAESGEFGEPAEFAEPVESPTAIEPAPTESTRPAGEPSTY